MHIGLLAPEFPPAVGGMGACAVGFATQLARSDQITVYTLEGRGDSSLPVAQKSILMRDLEVTGRRLRDEQVDVWFCLNAGLVALAPHLDRPMAAMFNGNDFINPWLVYRRPWLEPWTAGRWRRQARALRRALSRRDIDRGLDAAGRVFAISASSARLLDTIYPGHRHKVSIVPPGVDEVFFSSPLPRAEERDGRRAVRLLTVARLESWTKRKNVDGVLQALALLPHDCRIEYTVVGDGDDRPRLERLATELGVSDRVFFAGGVEQRHLLQLYRESDLFVLAARARPNDVEGFGIVYLEAAAMGVPAVCSREGGATDAVVDGETGLVLDSSAPDAIAQGILRFIRMRDVFEPTRLRAFADGFRWPRIAATIRSALHDVHVPERTPAAAVPRTLALP